MRLRFLAPIAALFLLSQWSPGATVSVSGVSNITAVGTVSATTFTVPGSFTLSDSGGVIATAFAGDGSGLTGIEGGSATNLTPWTEDIDAGGWSLTNVADITMNSTGTITGTIYGSGWFTNLTVATPPITNAFDVLGTFWSDNTNNDSIAYSDANFNNYVSNGVGGGTRYWTNGSGSISGDFTAGGTVAAGSLSSDSASVSAISGDTLAATNVTVSNDGDGYGYSAATLGRNANSGYLELTDAANNSSLMSYYGDGGLSIWTMGSGSTLEIEQLNADRIGDGGGIDLIADVNVTGSITMTNGNLYIGSNNLVIGTSSMTIANDVQGTHFTDGGTNVALLSSVAATFSVPLYGNGTGLTNDVGNGFVDATVTNGLAPTAYVDNATNDLATGLIAYVGGATNVYTNTVVEYITNALSSAQWTAHSITGTTNVITPANGNLQTWTLTDASYAAVAGATTNYTETFRLNLIGAQTITWDTSNLLNSATVELSNSCSVLIFDHPTGTNMWWVYQLR